MMRLLYGLWVILGPFAFQAGLIVYGLGVVSWVQSLPGPPGPLALLLVLPPFVSELAFTWGFEVRRRGYTAAVLAGLAVRLLFAGFVAVVFVLIPFHYKGTWDGWFVQDLAYSPQFLRMVWAYSPIPAAVFGALCAAAYLHWTVRRRQARLTTTMILPFLATFALYVVLYYFPSSEWRGGAGERPAFVQAVWTPTTADHRIPREVRVTSDERHAVATFGSTFPVDSSDPPPNVLHLGPRCEPPNFAECRRNLALIDLDSGETQTWSMTITRRFDSEVEDRVFVTPYRLHVLIELMLDGTVRTYPLPDQLAGERFEEINHTYFAPDLERVYLTSGNNPLVVVWSTATQRIEQVLSLAGWNGLALGDVPLTIARNRKLGRLYVTVKADRPQVVEIDEQTMQPLRSFGPVGYEVQVSPDGESIYVSSFVSGDIWRFDARTLERVAHIEVPVQCRRLSFSPDGSRLFAASYITGELVIIDTATNERIDSFYVARRLEGMHVAGDGLYLLSSEGLFRVPLDVLQALPSHPSRAPAVAVRPAGGE